MDSSMYWILNKDHWTTGVIISPGSKDGFYKVKLDQGQEIEVRKDHLVLYTESSLKLVNDLITLDELSEPVLLYNLEQRYRSGNIYTYIGPIIISINPYKHLDHLGEHLIDEYHNATSRKDLEPHPYIIARECYRSLVALGQSQSITISGESGAGKTESTKIILKYLTRVSLGNTSSSITEAILATNPILEAFGNAKTIRNNNSSRFGKLIKIIFEQNGTILGATINNYLLETTRIVDQAPGERNYHIFYALIKGASPSLREKYKILQNISSYQYLTNGDIDTNSYNDVTFFGDILNAFKKLNFTQNEIDELFLSLSGILHLGNIKFTGRQKVELENEDLLDRVSDTLKIDKINLKAALTSRLFTGGGRSTMYSIPLTLDQAIENRDAMAKALYSKLFDFLILRINQTLSGNTPPPNLPFIAILDIYGFEMFEKNSLEQLCINYANEKLQESFIHNLFKAEQAEYKKEGISWKDIKFKDNKEIIDLIERNYTGVLALLNEECQVKGDDKSFFGKLIQHLGKSPYFSKPIKKQDVFEIKHFAGTVEYNVIGFIEKNRNTLNKDVLDGLSYSELEILKKFFTRVGNSVNQTSKATVCQIFKKELSTLIDLLNRSERHYIRCIKPNNDKIPMLFQPEKVLSQLQNNGVMETVALRKAGFSNKMVFSLFYQRYAIIGVKPSNIEACLIRIFTEDQWALGLTKIFLQTDAVEKLELIRQKKVLKSVIIIQSFFRSYRCQVILLKLAELERIRREEERRRREEEERRRREEEERKRREEEERKRREEEERKRREEEERKRREEEERKRREEEERKRREEEERKRREEEERKRIEEERKRKEEEEIKRREEEERKRLEEERKRRDEEERRRREEEDRKKREEEERKKREEEERKRREEADRKKREEEDRKKREEEDRKKREEEERKKREDEQRKAEEKRVLDELERRKREAEERRLMEESELQKKRETEEKRVLDELERRKREADERRVMEELDRRKKEAEERRKKEDEDLKKQQEERKKREEEDRKKKDDKRREDLKKQIIPNDVEDLKRISEEPSDVKKNEEEPVKKEPEVTKIEDFAHKNREAEEKRIMDELDRRRKEAEDRRKKGDEERKLLQAARERRIQLSKENSEKSRKRDDNPLSIPFFKKQPSDPGAIPKIREKDPRKYQIRDEPRKNLKEDNASKNSPGEPRKTEPTSNISQSLKEHTEQTSSSPALARVHGHEELTSQSLPPNRPLPRPPKKSFLKRENSEGLISSAPKTPPELNNSSNDTQREEKSANRVPSLLLKGKPPSGIYEKARRVLFQPPQTPNSNSSKNFPVTRPKLLRSETETERARKAFLLSDYRRGTEEGCWDEIGDQKLVIEDSLNSGFDVPEELEEGWYKANPEKGKLPEVGDFDFSKFDFFSKKNDKEKDNNNHTNQLEADDSIKLLSQMAKQLKNSDYFPIKNESDSESDIDS